MQRWRPGDLISMEDLKSPLRNYKILVTSVILVPVWNDLLAIEGLVKWLRYSRDKTQTIDLSETPSIQLTVVHTNKRPSTWMLDLHEIPIKSPLIHTVQS